MVRQNHFVTQECDQALSAALDMAQGGRFEVEKFIKGTDTCGVHNLHGMPGVLGGVIGVFVSGAPGIQLGGIAVTVVLAFVFGKITGIIISVLGQKEVPYSDEDEFIMSHE